MRKGKVCRGGLTFPSLELSGGSGADSPLGRVGAASARLSSVPIAPPHSVLASPGAPTPSATAPPSSGFLPLPFPWGADSPSCHVSLMTSTQSARP